MVEKTKDWREVAEEKLEELEALAETLKKMALWHLGVTEEHGSVRPFAEEEPASWKAASILESVSRIQVSCAVARCRVLETEKAADRKRREYGKISAALSEVESAARVKAWQEREVAKA